MLPERSFQPTGAPGLVNTYLKTNRDRGSDCTLYELGSKKQCPCPALIKLFVLRPVTRLLRRHSNEPIMLP